MSDLATESLGNLEAKLTEYRSNLQAIEIALEGDPKSEEFLRLKSDLEEVISFFSDLVQHKRAEKSVDAAVPDDSPPPAAETAADGSSSPSKFSVSALSLVGRTCVVTSTLTFGEIVGLGSVDRQSRLPVAVQVKWFASGVTEDMPVSNVRLLTPLPAESVRIGMHAQALYAGDGQWYKCVVKGIEAGGGAYEILYPEYLETEVIPSDRLRPVDASLVNEAPAGAKDERLKRVKEVRTPAGYVIPMSLIVKPTDTDAQRAGKRRRLTKLKKDQKMSAAEEEARQRQSAWMVHARKTSVKARLQTALLRAKEGCSLMGEKDT